MSDMSNPTRTFKLRKMSAAGDEVVAEWTADTTVEQLDAIAREFNSLMSKGYFAANLDTNEIVREFAPNAGADLLMIPRMQGGAR